MCREIKSACKGSVREREGVCVFRERGRVYRVRERERERERVRECVYVSEERHKRTTTG